MAEAGAGAPAPDPIDTEAAPAAGSRELKDHMNCCAGMEDALQQRYTRLCTRFRLNDPNQLHAPQALHEHAVASSNITPKVFLCHAEVAGKPVIEAMHRMFKYVAHPLETTTWDGEAFGFIGDVMRGNAIKTRRFPDEAFCATVAQRAPTVAAMDPLLQTLAADTHYLPAPGENAPDTRLVTTRNMAQVPHKYISVVLNKTFTPKQLWLELGGAIRNDAKEEELATRLDWICIRLAGAVPRPHARRVSIGGQSQRHHHQLRS